MHPFPSSLRLRPEEAKVLAIERAHSESFEEDTAEYGVDDITEADEATIEYYQNNK